MPTTTKDDLGELTRRMRQVSKRVREAMPLSPPVWEAGGYPIPTFVNGRPDTNPLVWFPSPGCVWSLEGGCTMCDFGMNTNTHSVEEARLAFETVLDQIDPGVRRIHLAAGGSFFHDREVSPELRIVIARSLDRFRFLRNVGIESRPNLVTSRRLTALIESLPPQVNELMIGFGLECLDDVVREVNVNKGYGPPQIDQAIQVIERANQTQDRVQVSFEAYVLLKPLFLSEQEGISEALRTIDWAYTRGAAKVMIFPNSIKERTVQGYLATRTDLDPPVRPVPPYLRSAVEVLRALPPDQRRRTRVLGFQSGIAAAELPRGCSLCIPFLMGALMAHNFTEDPRVLDEAAISFCPCKASWREEMAAPATDLLSRIRTGLDILEHAFPA